MAAISRIIALMGLLMTFLVTGCALQERLNGSYEGFRDVRVNPGTDPYVARQLARVLLIARIDGTASLSDQGIAVEGHIEYGGRSATFIPESIAGVSMDFQKPELRTQFTVPLVPLKDGTWLYGGEVKLTRLHDRR
jgi:hypothetical protein